MKWKRYPQYKDTGIEWLGEIPDGWGVRKMKHVASVKFSSVDKKITESQQPVRICNYMDVYYNDFITSDLKLMEASASNEEIARFSLKEGDVLITKDSESWDDIAVPAYVSLALTGVVCGYHLAMVCPNTALVDGKYLFRSFCFPGINYQYRVEATGITRYGLGKYWLDNSLFLLPPKEEQQAIVNFLDCETSRIDKLIEKKEKQIELLKEQRAAIINRAVTKGLNPNVKMKDSGIDWLGEIPEGWGVRKLKHIASVKLSSVDKKITEGQKTVQLCNYMDVYYNDFITSDLKLMEASASNEEIARFSLKEGDVLITKDSESWDDIAVPAYVSLDLSGVICGYHLALVRPNTALVDGKYLFRSFCSQGINYQYRVEATGITRYGLGKYWLDNSLFLLPSKEEQHAIAVFLDRETTKIDTLIEKVQKSIELLREYRTAIISATVTGKIDVRNERF